jgi:hypothetical protein
LIDAPPDELTLADVPGAPPSLDRHSYLHAVRRLRRVLPPRSEALPGVQIGFVGAHTMVLPGDAARCPAVDFVTTGEFDLRGAGHRGRRPYAEVTGVAYRAADRTVRRTPCSRRSTTSTPSRSSPTCMRAV